MSERRNPLRNLLNRLVWDRSLNPGDYAIYFESRGTTSGFEVVKGDELEKVYLRGFEARMGGKVKYIPFHRVFEVRNETTGEILYRARNRRVA
jgi:uncharacterized protein (UPF0248 family)